ncbi:MAG: hypothetical protein IH621_18400 [Krumholzibacteria bacterium]|nr:hypothetical protein [Candidatus Krumholzibacteria bacterium]
MSPQEFVAVLGSLFGLVMIWVALWILYPRYAVDKFRQEMFAVRDDLFDEADSGRLAFDSEAYLLLRSLINSHIRYAHRLTLLEFFGVIQVAKKHQLGADYSARFESVQQALSDEQRDVFMNYYLRAMSLVFRKLVLGSAFVMLILPALLGAIVVKHWIARLLHIFEDPVEGVNGAFIEDFHLEECAANMA